MKCPKCKEVLDYLQDRKHVYGNGVNKHHCLLYEAYVWTCPKCKHVERIVIQDDSK